MSQQQPPPQLLQRIVLVSTADSSDSSFEMGVTTPRPKLSLDDHSHGDDASRMDCCDTTTASSVSNSSSAMSSRQCESREKENENSHQMANSASPTRRKLFAKETSWKSNNHELKSKPKKQFRLRPRFHRNSKSECGDGDASIASAPARTTEAATETTTETTTTTKVATKVATKTTEQAATKIEKAATATTKTTQIPTKESGALEIATNDTEIATANDSIASSPSSHSNSNNSTSTPNNNSNNNNNNNNILFQDDMDIVAYQEWPPQRRQQRRYKHQYRYHNGKYYHIQYPIQESPSSICDTFSIETVATKLGRSPVVVSFDDVDLVHPPSDPEPFSLEGRIPTGLPHNGKQNGKSLYNYDMGGNDMDHRHRHRTTSSSSKTGNSFCVTESFLKAIESTLSRMTCSSDSNMGGACTSSSNSSL